MLPTQNDLKCTLRDDTAGGKYSIPQTCSLLTLAQNSPNSSILASFAIGHDMIHVCD